MVLVSFTNTKAILHVNVAQVEIVNDDARTYKQAKLTGRLCKNIKTGGFFLPVFRAMWVLTCVD